MTVVDIVYLLAVGLAGGIITALVGGASLVTYPALLAIGLPPITAVIVNLVALMPANLSAAWWDRRQLPPIGAPFWAMLVVAGLGATLGAWLLLLTPEKVFTALVPVLLGLSTLLFAYGAQIARFIESGASSDSEAERKRWVATILSMVPVSIYGGYFGAGAGVMLLAILMIVARGDYRGANAIKNIVAGVNSLAATIVFIIDGGILWWPVVVVTIGALVGADIGIRIVRVVPREPMRKAVIGIGVLLTVVFAWKYWL